MEVEIVIARLERAVELFIVPKSRKLLGDFCASRQAVQPPTRQFVLLFDKLASRWRIGILKAAVGVRDFHAVVVVPLVALRSAWIVKLFCRLCAQQQRTDD